MTGKRLNSQARNLGAKRVSYFTAEKENNGPLIPLNAIQELLTILVVLTSGTSALWSHLPPRQNLDFGLFEDDLKESESGYPGPLSASYEDESYEDDVKYPLWFEMEHRASLLSREDSYEDDYGLERKEYEEEVEAEDGEDVKYPVERSSFVLQERKRCKEVKDGPYPLQIDGFNVLPEHYYNISCIESQDHYPLLNTHRKKGTLLFYCKAHNERNECMTMEKEMHVFKKRHGHGHCWTFDVITVKAGCRCF